MKVKSLGVLISGLLVLATSCEGIFDERLESDPHVVFDHFWETMDDYYANFEARKVDWDSIYDEYMPKVANHVSADSLYEVLTKILTILDDGHVTLIAPDKRVFDSNRFYRNRTGYQLFDFDVVKRQYLDEGFTTFGGKGDAYGTINQNTLYIHFSVVNEDFQYLEQIIRQNPASKGIIIDLRHNTGGNFKFAFQHSKVLSNNRHYVLSTRTKNGPGDSDYDNWHDWIFEGTSEFNKPIVVLTDRFTISAAERATLLLKAIPNTTIIGDTTNGSLSNMISRELLNGWYLTLATQNVWVVGGDPVEGIGISPDIYSKNSEIDIQLGIDRTLETAIALF